MCDGAFFLLMLQHTILGIFLWLWRKFSCFGEKELYLTWLSKIQMLIFKNSQKILEAAVRRCSSNKVFLKTCDIHRKIPVLESLRPEDLQLYEKETPMQVLSCEYCEIYLRRVPLKSALRSATKRLLPYYLGRIDCWKDQNPEFGFLFLKGNAQYFQKHYLWTLILC